jgi:hypothetical protein
MGRREQLGPLRGGCHVGERSGDEGRILLGSGRDARRITPCRKRRGSKATVRAGGGEVTTDVECVVCCCVHRQEALRRGRRFEPLQLAFPSSDRHVRTLGSVVHPLSPKMARTVQPQITKGRGISRIFVCHPDDWNGALLLEQLAHQPAGRSLVPLGPVPGPRGLHPRRRRRARGTSACHRCGRTSHRDAIDGEVRGAAREGAERSLDRMRSPTGGSSQTSTPRSASRSSMSR